ncbi:MAG: hypothetical protein J6S56_05355, partial [Bacteroidales bacterium]|nr:hypothetical protein [Bacteroidales bacterium]
LLQIIYYLFVTEVPTHCDCFGAGVWQWFTSEVPPLARRNGGWFGEVFVSEVPPHHVVSWRVLG